MTTTTREQEQEVKANPAHGIRPQADALTRALEAIRTDSREAPKRYLDETVTPHGGE